MEKKNPEAPIAQAKDHAVQNREHPVAANSGEEKKSTANDARARKNAHTSSPATNTSSPETNTSSPDTNTGASMHVMLRVIGLLVGWAVFWALLSGIFDHKLLYWLGALSLGLTLAFVHRLKLLDAENSGWEKIPGLLLYLVWLSGKIFQANIAVMRQIIATEPEVDARLITFVPPMRRPSGIVLLANSITLTPGTVSVDVGDDKILVHALNEAMAHTDGLQAIADRVRLMRAYA